MYKTLNKIDTTFFELAQGDVVTAEMWNNLNRFHINQGNDVVDVVNILQTDITRLEERYKHIGIYYGEGEAPSWAYLQIVPTGDEGISLITWRDALDRLEQATDSVQTALESGALVGPRGEKGDKGDKGDTPEVDQVYDPTSANPQSGIALSPVIGAITSEIADARVDNFGNTSSSLGDNVRWMHHDLDSRKANTDHEHSAEHIAIPAGIPHEQANENVYGALWSLNEEKSNKQEVANALKGTASGSVLALNDVSPVEHTMGIKVRGKNLFNGVLSPVIYQNTNFEESADESGVYKSFKLFLPKGTYTLSFGVNVNLVRIFFDGLDNGSKLNITSYTFTLHNDGYAGFTFRRNDETVWVEGTEIQLEEGTEASAYAPYISDVTAIPEPYINYFFNHRCVFRENGNETYWAPIYIDKTFEPVAGKTYYVEISNSAERPEASPEAYNVAGTCTATANSVGGYTLQLNGYIRIETCSEGHGETWTNSFKITYMQAPSTAEFNLKIGEEGYITKAVKVSRCGKNIVNIPTIDSNSNGSIPCYITEPITISGINDNVVVKREDGTTADIWRIQVVFADGTTEEMLDSHFSSSRTFMGATKPSIDIPITEIKYRNTYLRSGKYKNIQVEYGKNATEYEPYIPPTEYTPNADGTVNGVTSLYPCTNLSTNVNGIVIECEYNRDINKAFAELQQAIISLGGNV